MKISFYSLFLTFFKTLVKFLYCKNKILVNGGVMILDDLLKDVRIKNLNTELYSTHIKDIKISDKDIEEGDVYVALKGSKFDGNDFIQSALSRGASVVISEEKYPDKRVVQVEDARSAYALICKNFFDRACDKLKIIGITGTNGKTTIANVTTDILRFAGAKVGTIGTLGAKIDNQVYDTGLTTPDPYMLHKLFKEMQEKGCEYAVMEASAHALALRKLDGIKFELGVLTNITEDHLDFFKDMDSYTKAKYKLFEYGRVKLGIICGDDERCRELLIRPRVPCISYGEEQFCDVKATDIQKSFDGSKFLCDYLGEKTGIKTNLVGDYNIQNALASIAICRSLGVPKELVRLGLSCINPVEGRFNIIKTGQNNVVIDYAHTPDGLEKILKTAKELSDNPLVVIFGCGGNRDRQKRPIMGEIACQSADEVILTSDNPRYEEPYEIIGEILQGATKRCEIIENRKKAIEYALKKYNNGETIVIAGKGAEKYQEIKGHKYPYNDFDVVYNYFRKQCFDKTDKGSQKGDEKLENYEEEGLEKH